MQIDPKESQTKDIYRHLVGAVAPRPIAFASTVDREGNHNLSPYSFFNAFGANPPSLIFSAARRIRDNTTKHTLENAWDVDEVVINVVTYDIAHQMVLTSTEYPKGVNEFEKAGFTALPSEKIQPYRVKESPVNFECKVKEVKPFGEEGGAGNLIICEAVLIHINDAILDENQRIDPQKLDPVGRLGGAWYTRASKGLMEIPNPQGNDNIGLDGLPDEIKNSTLLTGNELAQLGKIQRFPALTEVESIEKNTGEELMAGDNGQYDEKKLHQKARELLRQNDPEKALKVLMFNKKEGLR